MIARVLLAAILSGIAAGLVMGFIQHVRLTPLILQAETFEHVSHGHSAEPHVHNGEMWSPADGVERTAYTTLTAVVASVGFGLLLVGMSLLMKIPLTRKNAWVWGLCGFAAVSFAPALGLPPELPGMQAAALNSRIFWWGGTIVMTVMGLMSVYYYINGKPTLPAAAFFLLFPHVLSAPAVPNGEASAVPAHLAAEFVTASLGANLVMWLVLSLVLGYALQKLESIYTI
jgi:cobalt transporter subunit CbtA